MFTLCDSWIHRLTNCSVHTLRRFVRLCCSTSLLFSRTFVSHSVARIKHVGQLDRQFVKPSHSVNTTCALALCGRVPDLQSGGCGFESQPGLLRTGVGKCVPAAAGKAKAGMAHSDDCWCAGKTVKSLENTCHT